MREEWRAGKLIEQRWRLPDDMNSPDAAEAEREHPS
jgi:hypothetical protein